MQDELLRPEDVIEEPTPPVEPVANGWTATQARKPLLPAALLGIAVLLAWRFIVPRLLRDGAVESDWLPLVLGGVLPTIFILAYPVWSIRRGGGRVFAGWPGWGGLLIEGAIAFGALICVQAINFILAISHTLIFGEGPGIPEQFQEMVEQGSLATLVLMAVMACIWAPIAEELFFRRFVMRAFAGKFSLAVAIVLQAFVFAILHDYGGMHLTLIFVLGLAMGGLYAWRKTILTSMILHMLQNTMAIAFLGLIILVSRLGPPLGVYGEPADSGFRVEEIMEDSAAEKAGLQPGDIVTHVEGAPVPDALSLKLMYQLAGLDGEAGLTIKRDGEPMNILVEPATPAEEPDDNAEPQ